MKSLTFNIKALVKLFAICLIILQITSCASILVPKTQTIKIETDNDSTAIFVENEEQGIGKVKVRVKKNGVKEVVLKRDGYPTQYEAIAPTEYLFIAIPMCIFDMPFLGLGFEELGMDKMYEYPQVNKFKTLPKLVTKETNQKYINFTGINVAINDKTKDIRDGVIYGFSKDMEREIHINDSMHQIFLLKMQKREEKKSKGKQTKTLEKADFTISGKDIKRSNMLFKTLHETGFVDTINRVFLDQNNALTIDVNLNKSQFYHFVHPREISGKENTRLFRSKIFVTWYIRNSYNEKIDSFTHWSTSGSFSRINPNDVIDDAYNRSLQVFLANEKFKNYSKLDTNYNIVDSELKINSPVKVVKSSSDATLASVIIKRKDKGHGSGFAISNDGYILTNYHVIAGEYENKQADFTVILPSGEELQAKIIRFNKSRDIALLKVEKQFEKAFKLENSKSFNRLMEVYTIGTPKSIELGQSVSLGILSNERKVNRNNMLQLNMSVNSGNSGGPLFDEAGVLHGVVTSKLIGFATEGISFAIPSYMIAEYLNIKL